MDVYTCIYCTEMIYDIVYMYDMYVADISLYIHSKKVWNCPSQKLDFVQSDGWEDYSSFELTFMLLGCRNSSLHVDVILYEEMKEL